MVAPIVRREAERREAQPVRPTFQVLVVIGPPLVALMLHQAEYLLVPWACERGWRWPLHGVALLALLGTLGLGLLARRAQSHAAVVADQANSAHARAARRTHFIGAVGVGISALFTVTVLAYWIAVLVLDPCNRA
jgi:hypothetical protein